MRKFYVVSDRAVEVEVIKQLKPKQILVSYQQFKKKDLFDFILKIGYSPEIMVDPGAYTAYKNGITIDYYEYMLYIARCYEFWKNPNWIELHKTPVLVPEGIYGPPCIRFMSLDVIGDTSQTFQNYIKTISYGYINAIPVFHYGSDLKYLEKYINLGATCIALGGTILANNTKELIAWVRKIIYEYQDVGFHLLGNMNPVVLSRCLKLDSCDSSAWIQKAAFGYPRDIVGKDKEARIRRATHNMIQERYRIY